MKIDPNHLEGASVEEWQEANSGGPDKIERALLDASWLLGVVQGDPEFACLTRCSTRWIVAVATVVESTAILAEVLRRHARDTEEHSLARQTLRALLKSSETELVDVSTAVARNARELKSDLGLHTWDAIHLATAILAKVDVLIVRDYKFPTGDSERVYVTLPFDVDEDKLPPG